MSPRERRRDLALRRDDLADREQVALQAEELADRRVRVALVAVDHHRLDQLDPIAEPIEDVEVAVDDRVEDRVQQKAARGELAFAKPLLHEHQLGERSVVDRDDRVALHEDAELTLSITSGLGSSSP